VSNNIERKVVVITGASSGLGEASARLLSAEGARLNGRGGMALAITTDVTHCEQVKRLVDVAVQTYGRSIDLGPP